MESGRSVFYNELTGVVMVRATSDELGVVSAAMETFGGSVQAEWGPPSTLERLTRDSKPAN
jgi:hypothetical protein